MNRYYKLINLRSLVSVMGSMFLLASCSSYQYAGYENDGIYSSSKTGEAYTANDYEESYEDALYYKKLFGEKAEQFGAIPEEGAIFTDIESYTSGQYDAEMFGEEGLAYEPGRAAWGSDPDEISINIYNDYNPFYYGYGYPYYAGFYDPYWGPYYRYGYYNPYRYGYGYGYPFAYHSWGLNIGWSFGWGGYYGHRYSPYYYGHNYYPSYNRYDVAYSRGRRDTYSAGNRYRQSNNESRISRIQSYSNSRNVRAAGTSRIDARTYQTRTTRVNSSSIPNRRSSDSYRSSTQRREVVSPQTAPVRSSSPQVRTTRSSGNNNSTYRSSSSGSSTRSSGTTSSRSSRGRGN